MAEPELTEIIEIVYKKAGAGERSGAYFKAFFVELAEIIYQQNRELKLATYKIDRKKSAEKKRFAIVREIIKKTFIYKMRGPGRSLPQDPQFIFVVEYSSHLKEYSVLHKEMLKRNIPHFTVFINKTTFERYKPDPAEAMLVTSERSIGQHIRNLYLYWTINLSLRSSSFLKSFTGLKSSGFFRDVLFFNTKYLIENLNLLQNFRRIAKQYSDRPFIFFKSEGFRTRSLILGVQGFGNKVISIQHGSIQVEAKNYELPTDLYIVWSEVFRDALIQSKAGCNIESIGRPGFDEVFNQMHQLEPRQLNKEKVKILFLPNSGGSQTPYSEVLFALKACILASLENEVIELHIKPHPSDTSDRIMQEFLNLKSNAVMHPNTERISYNDYDIIATMNSNSGMEAAVYGKPLIILVSNLEMLIVKEYISFGIAELATSKTELLKAFYQIVNNYDHYVQNTKVFVDQYLANQGLATGKITDRLIKFRERSQN